VSKMRVNDGKVVADLFIYVDDGRFTALSKDKNWHAARQATSRLNELGIQEAPRKMRWYSQKPGVWAGSIVETSEGIMCVTVSEEKWRKSRRFIREILSELGSRSKGTLDFTALERKRGILIYVTRTYPSMSPYLKGIHQTLDSWRPNLDDDGCKLPLHLQRAVMELEADVKAPKRV
jgi:hypothetical protein